MQIRDYPYGKASTSLKKAVKWLNKKYKNGLEDFNFPDYGGLPKTISCRLNSDNVDWLQQELYNAFILW